MVRVELTTNTREGKRGEILTQVKLLVDIDATHLTGSLGGWVQGLDNLKNPITGVVEGVVLDEAEIDSNAVIYDNAILKDTARMTSSSKIYNNAVVGGNSRLSDTSEVIDNVNISGDCLLYNGAKIINDVNLIGCRSFNGGVLSSTPLQVAGSKDNLMYLDGILSIGCQSWDIQHWVKHLPQIAAENNYNPIKALEYLSHLNTLIGKLK